MTYTKLSKHLTNIAKSTNNKRPILRSIHYSSEYQSAFVTDGQRVLQVSAIAPIESDITINIDTLMPFKSNIDYPIKFLNNNFDLITKNELGIKGFSLNTKHITKIFIEEFKKVCKSNKFIEIQITDSDILIDGISGYIFDIPISGTPFHAEFKIIFSTKLLLQFFTFIYECVDYGIFIDATYIDNKKPIVFSGDNFRYLIMPVVKG